MTRTSVYSALTLRVRPFGESNREAWFLTSEEGLIKATVFGGPKSRLRARVAPFHEGKLWIYHDPVRDSRKVSDFDVFFYRVGIRELYERAMSAAALAETILSSLGSGGNWPEAARLASKALDALDTADTAACTRLAVYFFWRWARLLGLGPELSACSRCACEIKRDGELWYSPERESLFCENCLGRGRFSGAADSSFRIGPGARLWLKGIESLPPAAITRFSLDTPSLEQAKALSKAVLTAALSKTLPTWQGI
jgi:DNA repair protein RecO (recombination protein O)